MHSRKIGDLRMLRDVNHYRWKRVAVVCNGVSDLLRTSNGGSGQPLGINLLYWPNNSDF